VSAARKQGLNGYIPTAVFYFLHAVLGEIFSRLLFPVDVLLGRGDNALYLPPNPNTLSTPLIDCDIGLDASLSLYLQPFTRYSAPTRVYEPMKIHFQEPTNTTDRNTSKRR